MGIRITHYGETITLKEAIKLINQAKLRNLNDKLTYRKQRLNTRHRKQRSL